MHQVVRRVDAEDAKVEPIADHPWHKAQQPTESEGGAEPKSQSSDQTLALG